MTQRAKLPGPLDGRSFTTNAAAAIGVPRSRTRASDLSLPSRSIRVPRQSSQGMLDRCRPYTELSAGSFISHTTAAAIHGIPLPRWCTTEPVIHLSRAAGGAGPRRRGVAGHRLAVQPGDLVKLHGVAMTSPARTWLDLAGLLSHEHLICAGDYLVCSHQRSFGEAKHAAVPLADLEQFLDHHRRTRGIRAARAAFVRLRVGVDSPPETLVRLMAEDAGLPYFNVDWPVLDPTGGVTFWTDLACEEYRTCVEYDGAHHLTPGQQSADARRDAWASELGWAQVKLNKLDLRQGKGSVVAKVAAALRRQGWAG
ncbi:endonuclease domain-containing protein [Arthrobacter sp. TMN-50]